MADDGPDLVALDGLSDRGSAVADQPRDVLHRYAGVGEQRDEAVPQLARRPVGSGEPSPVDDGPELSADVGRVQSRSLVRAEHEVVISPLSVRLAAPEVLSLAVLLERFDSTRRQGEARRKSDMIQFVARTEAGNALGGDCTY